MKRQPSQLSNLVYIGIYLCIASVGLSNSLGLLEGTFKPPIFYTSVSGLICFFYFLISFINGLWLNLNHNESQSFIVLPRLKGAVTLCITVTLLIYHFIVYDGPVYTIDWDIFNVITHYIVPFMVIAHWIIFDPKGKYRYVDPIWWTFIPMIYFGWANVVAAQHTQTPYWDGKFYPYGFMDLTLHSQSTVLITVGVLVLAFIVLGLLVVAIDHALARKERIATPINR